jgi:hypothetical protein
MFSPFKEGQLVQIEKPKEISYLSAAFFFIDGETKAYMVAATTEEMYATKLGRFIIAQKYRSVIYDNTVFVFLSELPREEIKSILQEPSLYTSAKFACKLVHPEHGVLYFATKIPLEQCMFEPHRQHQVNI